MGGSPWPSAAAAAVCSANAGSKTSRTDVVGVTHRAGRPRVLGVRSAARAPPAHDGQVLPPRAASAAPRTGTLSRRCEPDGDRPAPFGRLKGGQASAPALPAPHFLAVTHIFFPSCTSSQRECRHSEQCAMHHLERGGSFCRQRRLPRPRENCHRPHWGAAHTREAVQAQLQWQSPRPTPFRLRRPAAPHFTAPPPTCCCALHSAQRPPRHRAQRGTRWMRIRTAPVHAQRV